MKNKPDTANGIVAKKTIYNARPETMTVSALAYAAFFAAENGSLANDESVVRTLNRYGYVPSFTQPLPQKPFKGVRHNSSLFFIRLADQENQAAVKRFLQSEKAKLWMDYKNMTPDEVLHLEIPIVSWHTVEKYNKETKTIYARGFWRFEAAGFDGLSLPYLCDRKDEPTAFTGMEQKELDEMTLEQFFAFVDFDDDQTDSWFNGELLASIPDDIIKYCDGIEQPESIKALPLGSKNLLKPKKIEIKNGLKRPIAEKIIKLK